MKQSLPRYETFVWAMLLIVSCLSWEIASGLNIFGDVRYVTSAVLVIAFIKTRFVLLDFMELEHAPLAARLFAELWWVGNCVILLALYWTSPQPTA